VDEAGRPVRVIVTAGTVNDCTKADELTKGIIHEALLADRAYDTNAIIETCIENGVAPVIPAKKNRFFQRGHDEDVYKYRHIVENVFATLKLWRGIATRYAKHTKSFLAAVQIACAVAYYKSIVDTP
jgi:transposase